MGRDAKMKRRDKSCVNWTTYLSFNVIEERLFFSIRYPGDSSKRKFREKKSEKIKSEKLSLA